MMRAKVQARILSGHTQSDSRGAHALWRLHLPRRGESRGTRTREAEAAPKAGRGSTHAVRFALFLPWLLAVILTGVVLCWALQPLARSLRLLGS
jgi:hypothetical protein